MVRLHTSTVKRERSCAPQTDFFLGMASSSLVGEEAALGDPLEKLRPEPTPGDRKYDGCEQHFKDDHLKWQQEKAVRAELMRLRKAAKDRLRDRSGRKRGRPNDESAAPAASSLPALQQSAAPLPSPMSSGLPPPSQMEALASALQAHVPCSARQTQLPAQGPIALPPRPEPPAAPQAAAFTAKQATGTAARRAERAERNRAARAAFEEEYWQEFCATDRGSSDGDSSGDELGDDSDDNEAAATIATSIASIVQSEWAEAHEEFGKSLKGSPQERRLQGLLLWRRAEAARELELTEKLNALAVEQLLHLYDLDHASNVGLVHRRIGLGRGSSSGGVLRAPCSCLL